MARVLLLDDEARLRRVLTKLLELDDHEVVAVADPNAGLRIIARESFDVVISDVVLGRDNGLDFVAQLRKSNKDLAVILITGEPNDATQQRAEALGVQAFLVKPITRNLLKATLASIEGMSPGP